MAKDTNLYEEIMDEIICYGESWDNIDFIGTREFYIPLDKAEQILNVDYDCGWGIAEINEDLVVMFKDGSWLERWEYDGSEGFEYKQPPAVHRPTREFGTDSSDYIGAPGIHDYEGEYSSNVTDILSSLS